MFSALFHAVASGFAAALGRDIVSTPPYVVPEVREDQDRDPDLQELTLGEELAAEKCEREWDFLGNAKRFQERYNFSEVAPELEPKVAAADAVANSDFFRERRASREVHRKAMEDAGLVPPPKEPRT